MFDSTSPSNVSTPTDDPEIISYPPVSRAAIGTLVLGIASALAPAGKFFWFLPIAAIVLAAITLVQFAKSKDPMSGKKLAVIGLFAAVFFGTCAWTGYYSYQGYLNNEAAKYSRQWVSLILAGKLDEAQQLTMPQENRIQLGTLFTDFYKSDTKRKGRYDAFIKDPVVQKLRSLDESARVRSTEFLEIQQVLRSELVRLITIVEFKEGGKTEILPIMFTVQRNYDIDRQQGQWFIRTYSNLTVLKKDKISAL